MSKRQPTSIEYRKTLPEYLLVGRTRDGKEVYNRASNPRLHLPADTREIPDLLRTTISRADIDSEGRRSRNKIVITIDLGYEIGVERCVTIEPQDEVFLACQPGRSRRTPFVMGREGPPTSWVSLILCPISPNDPLQLEIVSGWVGSLISQDGRFSPTQALVLTDTTQLDQTPKLPPLTRRGGQAEKVELSNINDLIEQKERELAVNATIKLLKSGFAARYITVQTRELQRDIDRHERGAAEQAFKLAKRDIAALVADSLGGPVVELSQEQGWRVLLRIAKKALDAAGKQTRLEAFTAQRLQEIEQSEEYAHELEQLKSRLKSRQQELGQIVEDLLAELEARCDDDDFKNATGAWTNAPDSRYDDAEKDERERAREARRRDSRGYLGLNGRGWNGLLIHFLEYRGSAKKKQRFENMEEEMTVAGLIAFTDRLRSIVEDCEVVAGQAKRDELYVTDKTDKRIVVMEDDDGNQRYYIFCPNRDLILGYKKRSGTLKISTVMANSSWQYVERVVELSMCGEDRGRINKLGPGAHCIKFIKPLENQEPPSSD